MTTQEICEFLMLAHTLNFSRAARTLHISQPALSRHVRGMEAELGVKLLRRDTHSVVLTQAGHSLADEAGRLLGQCDTALNMLHIEDLSVSGQVRVICSPAVCYSAPVREFMGRFGQRFPAIETRVEICAGRMGASLLDGNDFVVSFCEYADLPETVRTGILHTYSAYAALPARHRLMSRSIIGLHELAGETVIVPYADDAAGPYARNLREAEKRTRGQIRVLPVENEQTALFLAATGRGVVLIPGYACRILPPELFTVSIQNPECRFVEYLYYNSARENSAAKLFYEEFCSQFAVDPHTV